MISINLARKIIHTFQFIGIFVVIYSIQLSPIVSRVSLRTSTPSSHHSHNWRCGVMADDYNDGCGDDDET